MADGPPPRRFINTLADGDNVDEVYLVAEKLLKANRNGNLFLQLDLRDRTGGMSGRLWNAGEPLFRSFEEGDFLHVKGKVQLFQGSLQMVLSFVAKFPAERIELVDFLPHTTKDVSKLFERLRQILRTISRPHIRALGECFLTDDAFARAFCKAPAGVRNHHAYVGGLLEHVVNMLEVADRIAPLYPDVDRDLLLMGAFLHDVGKLRELTFERTFGYSDHGQLLGHLVLGVEMVNEMAGRAERLIGTPFPREPLLRLKHIVTSHHGTLEFGSPTVPMTPEAIAIHYIDNLDAKLHTFTRDIREDANAGAAWTPYNQSLGRRLFKGVPKRPEEEDEDE